MFEKLEITRMAQSLAAHAGAGMGVIAKNVAHADTPGYKAQDIPDFAETVCRIRAIRCAPPGPATLTRPAADGGPEPRSDGAAPRRPTATRSRWNKEMVKSAEARQEHEMALAIYRATSDVIRASLAGSGRGRLMNDLISSLSFAASGMEAQAMRLRHVSENIANADTPATTAR
jgi:flagellar basal-body rod protein FlgB